MTEVLAEQRFLPQQDLEGKEMLELEPFSKGLPSNWEPSQPSEMVYVGLSILKCLPSMAVKGCYYSLFGSFPLTVSVKTTRN